MSSVQIRQHFMWLVCQADKSYVMSSHIFAEIRKILRKCYLLNMLSAWMFNPWHGSNTFCCHVDAFCYLISDQVATTCYLRKKLISYTDLNLFSMTRNIFCVFIQTGSILYSVIKRFLCNIVYKLFLDMMFEVIFCVFQYRSIDHKVDHKSLTMYRFYHSTAVSLYV